MADIYVMTIYIEKQLFVSAWSSSGAAFEYFKKQFNLVEESIDEKNYFYHIPEGVYCSIDKMNIDRNYPSYGIYHDIIYSDK